MRDLYTEEWSYVYGAGGTGKSPQPPKYRCKGGSGGSRGKHSGSRGKKSGSRKHHGS